MYAGRLRPRSRAPGDATLREISNEDSDDFMSLSGKKRSRNIARPKLSRSSSNSGSSSSFRESSSSSTMSLNDSMALAPPQGVAWLLSAIRKSEKDASPSAEYSRVLRTSVRWSPSRQAQIDTWCELLGLRRCSAEEDSSIVAGSSAYSISNEIAFEALKEAALNAAADDTDIESETSGADTTPERPSSLARRCSPGSIVHKDESRGGIPRCDSLVDRMGQLNVLGGFRHVATPATIDMRSASMPDDTRPRVLFTAATSNVARGLSYDSAMTAPHSSAGRPPKASTSSRRTADSSSLSSARRRSSVAGALPFLPLFDDPDDPHATHEHYISKNVAKRFSFGGGSNHATEKRRDSTISTISFAGEGDQLNTTNAATTNARPPANRRTSSCDNSSSTSRRKKHPAAARIRRRSATTDDLEKARRMSTSPIKAGGSLAPFADRMQTPQHPCMSARNPVGWACIQPDVVPGTWRDSTPAKDILLLALKRHLEEEKAKRRHSPYH